MPLKGPWRAFAWLILLAIVAWLLSMTLTPGTAQQHLHLLPFSEKWSALQCVVTGCPWSGHEVWYLVIDLAGNIAVFVPFGAALALVLPENPGRSGEAAGAAPFTAHRWPGRRWWLALVSAGFLLSLGIELAQLGIPGRVTDIDDLILNVLGTLIGGAIVAVIMHYALSNYPEVNP